MVKRALKVISGILVVIVGAILIIQYGENGTAPFYSGIGFVIIGLNLWFSNCFLFNKCCKKDGSCSTKK